MPTKISKSPINIVPPRPAKIINAAAMAPKPAAQLGAASASSASGGLFSGINPVTGALMGAQLAGAGFMEGKESVEALKQADPEATGGQKLGAALGGAGIGIANQLLGTDFQFKNKAIKDYEKNMEAFMAEKSSLTMKEKPTKALTQMQGTTAHNMSAKQYNRALQMKEISGAKTLPSSLTMIENPSLKQEAAFDHNNDGKVSTKELKTTFNS